MPPARVAGSIVSPGAGRKVALPLFAAWAAVALPPPVDAEAFIERDGMVVIEAEHATDNVGAWEEVEGRNATANHYGTTHDQGLIVRAPLGDVPAGALALPAGTNLGWGFPNEAAHVTAVFGSDERKCAVFWYDTGAAMPAGPAPARRILVPDVDPDSPEPLWQLVLAGVRWATDGAPSRRLLFVSNQDTLTPEETEFRRRLSATGFEIVTIAGATVTPADAAGMAAIVVPNDVRVEKVAHKFTTSPVPLVTTKAHLAHFLGMTLPPAQPGAGDNAMLIRAGAWTDHLRYAIHFATPGEYRLWLLGQSGGDPGADEVKVFFDAAPDAQSTDFYEVRLPRQPGWSDQAFARRPQNRKTPVPATVQVRQAGWHNLYLVKGAEPESHGPIPPERRYPNWRVDKIVLARETSWRPEGDGPAPTYADDGAPALPASLAARHEWRPRQIWPVRDGHVVIEAEEIDHHAHWVRATAPAGFTGAAYLDWRGPGRSRSIEGRGGNDDHHHVRQGAPEEWLIVRLQVDRPGSYLMDLRNHHLERDGDNDVWVARIGARATQENPIVRAGDSLRDGPGFSWLDWGVARFEFTAGLNEVYVGGRSVGFGVDRIAVYREGNAAAKARALDPATPAAVPIGSPSPEPIRLSALRDFVDAPAAGRVPYYRDERSPQPERQALAINAREHPSSFARAISIFRGAPGTYRVTLRALTENDGESTYRVRVNGTTVGEARNPRTTETRPHDHDLGPIALRPGDLIEVESNTDSNGLIPEGTAFAWARGRWQGLSFDPVAHAGSSP